MTRIRIINPPVKYGTTSTGGVVGETSTWFGGGYAECRDTVGPGNGYPLTIKKVLSKSGGILNGHRGSPSPTDFANYCVFSCRDPQAFANFSFPSGHPGFGSVPSDSAFATRMLARTNPSRADVDIPVFVAELKDLPELVSREGGKLIKRIAKYNLRYQFAIRPLVSDLTAMLDFVSLAEKRFAELKQLSKGGLRRKRHLFDASATYVGGNFTADSTNKLYLRAAESAVKKVSIWGFVKWVPNPSLPRTDAALLALARRAVLGLTIDGATAWELIPFSWLVDWYGTVGSYLAATRNIVPCTPQLPVQIMKHYQGTSVVKFETGADLGLTSFSTKYEHKFRTNANPSPIAARLPVLSLRQLSILLSLAVTKSHGYRM